MWERRAPRPLRIGRAVLAARGIPESCGSRRGHRRRCERLLESIVGKTERPFAVGPRPGTLPSGAYPCKDRLSQRSAKTPRARGSGEQIGERRTLEPAAPAERDLRKI